MNLIQKDGEFVKENKLLNIIQKISNVVLWIVGLTMLIFTIFLLFPSILLIAYSLKYFVIGMFLSLIAALCSLLIIPATCETLTKKYNFNIRWWHKSGIILVWFFIFIVCIIIISLGFNSKTTLDTETVVQETNLNTTTLNITTLSAEEVIGKYAKNGTVQTTATEIEVVTSALKYSDDYNKDYNKLSLDYLKSVTKSCSKFTTSCKGIKAIYVEENEEFNLTCEPCPEPPSYSFNLINVSLIEENANESVYNVTSNMNGNVSSTFYKLQKINGEWKVVNRKISGKWITEMTLTERDKEFTKLKREIQDIADLSTNLYNQLLELRNTEKRITTSLKTILGEDNVIDVQIGQNDEGDYGVSIWYYFTSEWLTDDYLEAMDEIAAIYKTIFNSEKSITSVQITAIQLYRDEYGNVQQRTLAESSMDKSTAAKVNWDYFESQNLDDITYFKFYQDSLYKSLEDLQEQLERTQDYYEIQNSFYNQYMNYYTG
ncbi:hypothetical protein COV16_04240 [Candidatus Woesearchaeota archaeon CG10_big_fil_rev_8_21_14_0_10_34_8]|nr:MAG: hypothetical protein COV16_04240 [Candidatus Woesearchaeota archaeon CG10_big_fil_rev_8_21_14_0_10_34_8]